MQEIIIFLCGALCGLVTLLLGYFIRMGMLHNREIKSLRVDLNSAFRIINENDEDFNKKLESQKRFFDEDIENLHRRIGLLSKEIDESRKYTDKRIDKTLEKLN